MAGIHGFFDVFELAFDNKIGNFLLPSSLALPVVFIIISIIRKKVSVWELGAITIICGLVFYVLPHYRG